MWRRKLLPLSHLLSLLFFSAGLLSTAAQAQAQASPRNVHDPRGRWITASGNLEVEIADCGDALCGTVTKVLADNVMGGDGKPAMRAGPNTKTGLKILIDLRPDDDQSPPRHWRGQIFNRENDKTYSALVELVARPEAQSELLVRGYVGLPLFGQTHRWLRVAE